MADKKKILVVDDEPDMQKYICTLLEDNGYETESASNGNEALQKIKEAKYDCITLDMSMPEKSGIRFYRDIKEMDNMKDVPVVIVTAVTGYGDDPESFRKFIESRKQVPPPSGFVPKPFETDQLLGEIKKHCG